MRPDENSEELGMLAPQPGLEIADYPLDIRRSKMILELEADVGDHLVGCKLAREDALYSHHSWFVFSSLADRLGNLGPRTLANEEVLAFPRKDERDECKDETDHDGRRAVEPGRIEARAKRRRERRDRKAGQSRAVFKKHHEIGRVLARLDRRKNGSVTARALERRPAEPPAYPLEQCGNAIDDEVHDMVGHRLRMPDVVDPFVDRHARTEGEDEERHHEGPEIKLPAVTPRMKAIGRLGRAALAIEQQDLVAAVDDRVNGFAQHRRASRKRRRGSLR